jgi:hypothetical protein
MPGSLPVRQNSGWTVLLVKKCDQVGEKWVLTAIESVATPVMCFGAGGH